MRTSFLLLTLLIFFDSTYAQKKQFIIYGSVQGRDTGRVMLYSMDYKNLTKIDTAVIRKGKFTISGNVNRVCEALLWTNLKNHNFDDNTVIRFLLEPKKISIDYSENKEMYALITGSKSQTEKAKWDIKKIFLTDPKKIFQKVLDSVYRNRGAIDSVIFKGITDSLFYKIDSINTCIRNLDLKFIREHTNSFVSANLLSKHKRKLSIDTLQCYFELLSKECKESSEGILVLKYIYPLTNDMAFRNRNPLNGGFFTKQLASVKSIYDFALQDSSKKKIDFKIFKGQYLLIDFWASWCGPCIDNIPYLKKIFDQYKSDSIQFISVSLDRNSNDWKRAIKKYDYTGYQVSDFKGFTGQIAIYCKVVTGIPQYVLVDKNGIIINNDVPQPSNPKLKILIDSLLKK